MRIWIFFVLSICLVPAIADNLEQHLSEKDTWLRKLRIQKLRKDINFYNLLNGLHLSKKQVWQIWQLTQQAKRLKDKYMHRQPQIADMRRELAILKRMQTFARAGKEIPEWLGNMYISTRHNSRKGRIDPERYRRKLKELENQLQTILLAGQKQVIADYKPCLIPPKDLKNPVRAGQAQNSEAGIRILEKLRKQQHGYSGGWQLYTAMEKHLERIEHHQGKLSEQERKTIMEQWLKVIGKAQNMTDIDFELSKEELAKELKVPDKKEQLQKQIAQHAKKRNLPGKAAHFLLDPYNIPLLEQRLRQMHNPKKEESTDLTAIEKADNCDDGRCALPD